METPPTNEVVHPQTYVIPPHHQEELHKRRQRMRNLERNRRNRVGELFKKLQQAVAPVGTTDEFGVPLTVTKEKILDLALQRIRGVCHCYFSLIHRTENRN